MSKFVKQLLQRELEAQFKDIDNFLVIGIDGIGGNDNNQMRADLSEKGMTVKVVRNSLMRKVLSDAGKEQAKELFKLGQCTVAYGGDSIVDVAKEMVALKKKLKALDLKGAFVEGSVVGSEGVTELSKMPNRAELQAQIVQISQTPASNVAGAVSSPASNIAGCLKTLIEKKEEQAA
ncbi:50S ribosomal protein L10 [Sedimentisphaera cyanobacteriorum]|uniref:Large ribosomal subunit protein uL10 n=1 Tax=Sedimentisphaera cyanobacteriorum TaxID=1940790 RepID=A0A1Q2HSF8_9BACT|nr:50S ribosomal protein L10 [Sedimentisphaera cyanobacteriorum]AQQ10310.1 50S ribosomal protein L10 [Sedimentisphaera cyanobacteriorum]